VLAALAAGVSVVWPTPVAAQPSEVDGRWQFVATVYGWAAGTDATTAAGSDIDIAFDTLLDNLNMAAMGAIQARRNEWSLLADVIYLNVGANGGAEVPVVTPSGAGTSAKLRAGIKQRGWVLNLLGGYNLRDDEKLQLDAIAGARYLELKVDFELGLQSGLFGHPIETSALDAVSDAVVGFRGAVKLSPKWHLPFHLDIGAGQSDLTWQAVAGIGYRFDWGDVDLVYRHMDWDVGSDSPLEDLGLSGPQLAASFRF
jgi:hypothetical protein